MIKKVFKVNALIALFALLVSCNNSTSNLAQTNSQEINSIAPTNNVYIHNTYEFGDFEKLPLWAVELKQINSENSYATKVYTNNLEYRELVNEVFEDNEIVFRGILNEQKMFDTYDILVVARRLENYLYYPYCEYSNAYFEYHTNYIDINYTNPTHIENSNVNYFLDFVAIEKNNLSVNYANFVINLNYYKNAEVETKKVDSFKSMCVEADHDLDFKAGAKMFNSYISFCKYVNYHTDIEAKSFFDRSWFKNNYAVVVLRNANAHGVMCYEDIDIKLGKMTLTGYYVTGGALALENYVDIIFIPKHKLGIINTFRKYNVEYKVNYYK